MQAVTLVPQGNRYLACDKASGQVRAVKLRTQTSDQLTDSTWCWGATPVHPSFRGICLPWCPPSRPHPAISAVFLHGRACSLP